MSKTIQQVTQQFIEIVQFSRSENTARSYQNAINIFCESLARRGTNIEEEDINQLSEIELADFIRSLRNYSPSTEQMYLAAITQFYKYLVAEDLADINLEKVRLITSTRARKPGKRLPQFPKNDLEEIIEYALELKNHNYENERNLLRNLRDAAFILVLADTGLRVHEACNLRRGDIDWNEHRALIIGKGNQQSIVRMSSRSIHELRTYLNTRAKHDGMSRLPLISLPVFARHDRGAGKKILPMSTTTGRNIIKQRAKERLGEAASQIITPHSFRHYFVTVILQGSGGNLKLAQELARHKNIQVTQRYAHLSDDELDRGYHEIFERD